MGTIGVELRHPGTARVIVGLNRNHDVRIRLHLPDQGYIFRDGVLGRTLPRS